MRGDQVVERAEPKRTTQDTRLIWDLPTRLFHWLFTLSIIGAFVLAQEHPPLFYWHIVFGVAAGLLLVWRLFWGFAGSRYARFSELLFSPAEIAEYFSSVLTGQPKYYAGHTPGAALGIWLMLGLSAVVVATGFGAANEAIEDLHKISANALIAVAILHFIGVMLATMTHRENYVGAMFTGRKRAEPLQAIAHASPIAAVFMIVFICAGSVYFTSGLDFKTGIFHAPGTNLVINFGEHEAGDVENDDD